MTPPRLERATVVRPCAYCRRGTKRRLVLDYGVAACCVKCVKPYLAQRARVIGGER